MPSSEGLVEATDEATISTSEWPEIMIADERTIRAALLSCHRVESSGIRIRRKDREILEALREKRGWKLRQATEGGLFDKFGVRPGFPPDDQPVPASILKAVFQGDPSDDFGDAETEQVLQAFLHRRQFPDFIGWRRREASARASSALSNSP